MIEHASDQQLKDAFQTHQQETEVHAQRLESLIGEMDGDVDDKKDPIITALIGSAANIISESDAGPVRYAGRVATAQKIEPYEMASMAPPGTGPHSSDFPATLRSSRRPSMRKSTRTISSTPSRSAPTRAPSPRSKPEQLNPKSSRQRRRIARKGEGHPRSFFLALNSPAPPRPCTKVVPRNPRSCTISVASSARFLYPRKMYLRRLALWATGLTVLVAAFPSARAQALPASGQMAHTDIAPPPASTKDRYSAEPAVIESNVREIIAAADGTGSEHQTIVLRVNNDAAVKELSVISFTFASGNQRAEIEYIRVRHPDGTVLETPVKDALEMPTEVMRQAPFYSDLKQKQIPVRGLRAGDRLEWSVRLVRFSPEIPGRFWGIAGFSGTERVALAETLTLRLPRSANPTVWSPKQPAQTSDEGSDRVYRWKSSQLLPTVGPEAEARTEAEKKRTLTPDEIDERIDGALPLIAWTNFGDWPAVGAWYHGLEKDRATPDATVRAKAAELTAGAKTDDEKIRAVYAYVSTQVRYIGVALGAGRYQPHLASEVLGNQYGDCKDKATLLSSLLAAAGFQSDIVLIGPGIRLNTAVPSPAAFTHAITAVDLGSGASARTIWLDSTLEVAPYQALVALERDKSVLRVPPDGPAHLERTPANLPFPSFQSFEADGTLDPKGVVKGRLSYTFRGDEEIALRAAVRQLSPSQYDGAAQYFLASLGFGGKVTHATFTPPDHTEEPFVMSFDYERDKPGNDWDNYRIVLLEGTDGLPAIDEKEPPQLPIDLGTPRIMKSVSRTALPAGWKATGPEALHQASPWVRFDRTYRVEHGGHRRREDRHDSAAQNPVQRLARLQEVRRRRRRRHLPLRAAHSQIRLCRADPRPRPHPPKPIPRPRGS